MEMAKLLQWIVDLGSLKNDSEGREISDKSDFQIYECIGRLLIFIEINVFFIEEITTNKKISTVICEIVPRDRFIALFK